LLGQRDSFLRDRPPVDLVQTFTLPFRACTLQSSSSVHLDHLLSTSAPRGFIIHPQIFYWADQPYPPLRALLSSFAEWSSTFSLCGDKPMGPSLLGSQVFGRLLCKLWHHQAQSGRPLHRPLPKVSGSTRKFPFSQETGVRRVILLGVFRPLSYGGPLVSGLS